MADERLSDAPLIRITAPHFCAGLVLEQRAAPIIYYMNKWSLSAIRDYCIRKGWSWEIVSLSD